MLVYLLLCDVTDAEDLPAHEPALSRQSTCSIQTKEDPSDMNMSTSASAHPMPFSPKCTHCFVADPAAYTDSTEIPSTGNTGPSRTNAGNARASHSHSVYALDAREVGGEGSRGLGVDEAYLQRMCEDIDLRFVEVTVAQESTALGASAVGPEIAAQDSDSQLSRSATVVNSIQVGTLVVSGTEIKRSSGSTPTVGGPCSASGLSPKGANLGGALGDIAAVDEESADGEGDGIEEEMRQGDAFWSSQQLLIDLFNFCQRTSFETICGSQALLLEDMTMDCSAGISVGWTGPKAVGSDGARPLSQGPGLLMTLNSSDQVCAQGSANRVCVGWLGGCL